VAAAPADSSVAAAAEVADGSGSVTAAGVEADSQAGAAATGVAVTGPSHSSADGEGWEMVSRDVPSVKPDSSAEALETVRTLVESMAEEGGRV
jgi:hypothetical protein